MTARPSTPEEELDLVSKLSAAQFDKLEANRGKDHWLNAPSYDYLFHRLGEEVGELYAAIRNNEDAWSEAADVANFAAFIAELQETLRDA